MVEVSKLIDAITELDALCAKQQTELDKHRWIPVEEGLPDDIDYDRVVEAIEDCAEIPKFMTMAEIFLDEGSDVTHYRPIILPKE